MYLLEIDYEIVGPDFESYDEIKRWVQFALKAGALRVAVWQSDFKGDTQRLIETFWSGDSI